MVIIRPFLCYVILLQGVRGIEISTKFTNFTFHETKVDWNTAKLHCEKNGGHLARPDSYSNSVAIAKYWLALRTPVGVVDLWVGLAKESPDGFALTGSCAPLDWNAWQPGYPSSLRTDLCVAMTLQTSGLINRPCNDNLHFMCQVDKGNPCSYEKHQHLDFNTDDNSLNYTRVYDIPSINDCYPLCNELLSPQGGECWGFRHNTFGDYCKLFFGVHPFIVDEKETSGLFKTTYKKRCYSAESKTETIAYVGGSEPHFDCGLTTESITSITEAQSTTVAISTTSAISTTVAISTTSAISTTVAISTTDWRETSNTIRTGVSPTSIDPERRPTISTFQGNEPGSTESAVYHDTTDRSSGFDTSVGKTFTNGLSLDTTLAMDTTTDLGANSNTPPNGVQATATPFKQGQDKSDATSHAATDSITTVINPAVTQEANKTSETRPSDALRTSTTTSVKQMDLIGSSLSTLMSSRKCIVDEQQKTCRIICPKPIAGTMCPCYQVNINGTVPSIESILQSLTIDKNEISSVRRRYISATDDRRSARAVGSVGIVFLAVVFVTIVLADVVTIWRHIRIDSCQITQYNS